MSILLDTTIVLVFVFLAGSVVCSQIFEWIAGLVNLRGKFLKSRIQEVLGEGLAEKFNEHPLIRSLWNGTNYPAYIEPDVFGRVMSSLTIEVQADGRIKAREGAGEAARAILMGANRVEDAVELFGTWFQAVSGRLSGVYKRWAQVGLLAIALTVSFVAKVDTISIAKEVYRNPVLRQELVAAAEKAVKQAEGEKDPNRLNEKLRELVIPPQLIGKRECALGVVLSALAFSLGSPIWFELLGKLVNLRQAGSRPAVSAQ